MSRIVKEEAYAEKRNEILDAAQRLVYTKGYEQMTIQDILAILQISKGAFYHYFDSKQALLEGLIERMTNEALQFLQPIVQDPNLSAIEKLQRYLDSAVQWKTAQKDFLLALLRTWYADENAIARQKIMMATIQRIGPTFVQIIQQGIQEGIFKTNYPEQTTDIVFTIIQGLSETFARDLLSTHPQSVNVTRLEKALAAYNEALERILGAPPGSVKLMNMESIRKWLTPPADNEVSVQPVPSNSNSAV